MALAPRGGLGPALATREGWAVQHHPLPGHCRGALAGARRALRGPGLRLRTHGPLGQEHDGLLGIIDALALASPAHSRWLPWLPPAVFVLLRLGIVRRVRLWRLRLSRLQNTRNRDVDRRDEADAILESLTTGNVLSREVRLPGRVALPRLGQILNADVLGPVMTLDGFAEEGLNGEYVLFAGEDWLNGHPVFRSRDGGRVLHSMAAGPWSSRWILRHADAYKAGQAAAKPGTRDVPGARPRDVPGICAISPANAELSEVPCLGWQELVVFEEGDQWQISEQAGVQLWQKASFPAQVLVLPQQKGGYSYDESLWRPAEACLLASCSLFMLTQAAEYLVMQKVVGSWAAVVRGALSRARWIVLVTCCGCFLHQAIAQRKERLSRARAMSSDILRMTVLGSEYSQAEARLNAVSITLQVLTWMTWVALVMTIFGVDVSRVLLVPSIGFVLLGVVGRDIVSNLISCFVIYLTQPFSQGDWITLETGQDGWVQEIGKFYTRVCQADKRPVYVPNLRLIQMTVQNNSRMTNRRCLLELKLRLQDVPKIPSIVSDIEKMLCEHEHIDDVQHRLVSWRSLGDYYARVWVSCYTRPTAEGIRMPHFISVEQSLLERISAIVFRHGADFASAIQRTLMGNEALAQAAAGGVASSEGAEDEVDVQLREREEQVAPPSESLAELLLDEQVGGASREERLATEEELQQREQRLTQREAEVDKLREKVRALERSLEEDVRREVEEDRRMRSAIAAAVQEQRMLEDGAAAAPGAEEAGEPRERRSRPPELAPKLEAPAQAVPERPSDPPIAVKDMGD